MTNRKKQMPNRGYSSFWKRNDFHTLLKDKKKGVWISKRGVISHSPFGTLLSNHVFNKQAMPQLTDRSKLPNIVDPVIRNSMDLKHLFQVRSIYLVKSLPMPSSF